MEPNINRVIYVIYDQFKFHNIFNRLLNNNSDPPPTAFFVEQISTKVNHLWTGACSAIYSEYL